MAVVGNILIVGAGGLGVPAAIALVRAGARSLALADPDPVEVSNLHRQIIYRESDLGHKKVHAAARHLRAIAPAAAIEELALEIDSSNARKIVSRFDFVIDGTDNPAAKFLINDVCVALGKPFVYGGVLGMGGQAMTVIPGKSACLRCVFEAPPDPGDIASCREAGILGPVAGLIGEVQAREALRFLSGQAPEICGAILTYDGAGAARVRVTRVNPRPGCACAAAIDASVAAIEEGK